MLTAVRNFLSLTPTPPHPHIHLSNMTPLPTRRRPGSQPSPPKPDFPHLLCSREMSSGLKTLLLWSPSPTGRPLACSFSSLCSPVRDGARTMDHFHGMWESLLFRWLPGRQPLPSLFFPLFTAFGSINMGAHLMWSTPPPPPPI